MGQRCSRGHKARGQGHKKISQAKDSLFEDRPFLGQGHRRKCSPKKDSNNTVFKKIFSHVLKKGLLKSFSGDLQKTKLKTLQKKQIFLQTPIYKILRIPKILLSSSREQGNFQELEALRPTTSNVSSRTPAL